MNTDPVKVTFQAGFVGEMTSPTGSVPIGRQENGMMPYHLLYGALASCFYATFLGVAEKMRVTFSSASIEIVGNKRSEVPTTLDQVKMVMIIHNPSDENKLRRAAELGAEYCSIHETIAKVAKIELEVQFTTDEV